MLKILIVGMMDVKGGIEQFVIQLFRRLDKSEIHCDFLCYCRKCAYEEELLAAGSSVYHVTRRGENPLRCRRELKAFSGRTAIMITSGFIQARPVIAWAISMPESIQKQKSSVTATERILKAGAD